MPRSRSNSWEIPDPDDWRGLDVFRDAQETMSVIRGAFGTNANEVRYTSEADWLKHWDNVLMYRDRSNRRVQKKVYDIVFGPNGRRALVGDDEPDQEAA